MVYARKALIRAGLLDTMVPQSYLDNLIETCPQITRNAFAGSNRREGSNPSDSAKKTTHKCGFFALRRRSTQHI